MLRKEDIVAAKFVYSNKGSSKHLDVGVSYIDEESCFVSLQDIKVFDGPHENLNGNLFLYTEKGFYNIEVKLSNYSFSFKEIVLEFTFKKGQKWNIIEMRLGKRKTVDLSSQITFYNGEKLLAQLKRLSESGFSCELKEELDSSLKQFPCDITIKFPINSVPGSVNNEMQLKAKFLRIHRYQGYLRGSFKFINLTQMQIDIIRIFLDSV